MRLRKRSALLLVSGVAMLAMLVAGFFALGGNSRAANGNTGTTMTMKLAGSGSISASGSTVGSDGSSYEIGPDAEVDQEIPHSSTVMHVAAANVPTPAGNAVASSNPGSSGFNGISHLDQRLAGTGAYSGTQFSLEPPDQALCVGNGYVLESVNTALRVYSTNGSALTPTVAINQFLGLTPEINRSTLVYGDFTSDPKCYYDAATGRWFFTVLQADIVPSTGDFAGPTHVYVAVSQTSDPTKKFNVFVIDTTNDGTDGTPKHAGCPCLGDQPLIGADANGFYVTTNEFPWPGGFNGAQVYAMSKIALERGSNPTVVTFNAGTVKTPDAGGIWYSLQPATVPAGGSYASANGGTEYFLSALDFSGHLDNRIAQWTLTNTSSLASSKPSVSLAAPAVMSSEVYGQPPNAIQKSGSIPLAASIHDNLELLASNDDRMNQVVYANGHLYSGVNTVVQTPNGPTRVGVAYFIVDPAAAAVSAQGYVSVNQENVLFPAIGVSPSGHAVVTFTLVGPDYFPSAAYATINADGTAGDVHIAGAGAGPDDGFTGYKAYGGGGVGRWGDYSAAVADADGSIWLATEYIPNAPRTSLANWGTYVMHVTA